MMSMMIGSKGEHQSRFLDELCALLLTVLRSAAPNAASTPAAVPPLQLQRRVSPVVSAAGIASLLLGASTALMLCGSVTLLLGFFLMPWVIGLLAALHLVGALSSLSFLWRALISARTRVPANDLPGQLLTKLLTMLLR